MDGQKSLVEPTVDECLFDVVDDGKHCTLRVDGVLDAVTAPALLPTVERLLAGEVEEIDVDVSQLELIDSSGVAVIVALLRCMRARGRRARVIGMRGQPRSLFELVLPMLGDRS